MTAAQTPLERVVSALVQNYCDPKQAGDGFQARCPAHDDRNPSLSLNEGGDGQVLIKCFANCETADVLVALGLDWKDLFMNDTDPSSMNSRRIVEVYDYTDEQAVLLYQCLRYEPKAFKQRQPDGNSGWTWNLNGVRRVLYHLPEVRTAVTDGETVFLTEGEKDTDRLRALGLVATCNPGGAGKWRQEYTDSLAGAAGVVVCTDDDEPGRRHATQVAGRTAARRWEHRHRRTDHRQGRVGSPRSGAQLERHACL